MPEDSEYPFPELIVLMGWLMNHCNFNILQQFSFSLGFLFILLVETIAAKFLGGHGHHGHSHGHSHENQHQYGTNNGYNHNESNGNGHIGNGKIIEVKSYLLLKKTKIKFQAENGFYKPPTNQHGHPVCLTSYQVVKIFQICISQSLKIQKII